MSYGIFAHHYDRMMELAPYDEWIRLLKGDILPECNKPCSVLDLGAGTGQIAIPLLEEGYAVTAVDNSSDMLSVLQKKAVEKGLQPILVDQDMRELDLPMTFDLICCFCDSLNYITEETDIEEVFRAVFKHLENENGVFIFDVHSMFKATEVFPNYSFGDASEECSYIWNVFEGEQIGSVEHELTFFIKGDDGQYTRYDEDHFQRTFSVETYLKLLKRCGFKDVEFFTRFERFHYQEEDERVFFLCRKGNFS